MSRFIRRGKAKVMFAPTVADKNAVQRTEIDSATDLTPHIAEINGWALENQSVPVPDMGSTFDKSIPGTDTAGDSSLVFYEDDEVTEIETLLPKGTVGVVLLFRQGDVPTTNTLDVFPIRVGSRAAEYTAGNEPARQRCNFTITDEPALDTAVPAAGV